MKILLISFLIFIQGIIFAQSEHKLLKMSIANMVECLGQTSEKFSTEVCQEMLLEGNDNTQEKYNECKCVGACTVKRMQLMNEKGEMNYDKFKEYASTLETDSWINDANVVFDKCRIIENTGNDCEFAYQWMQCGLANSQMTRELVKMISGTWKNSSDAGTN